jgi:hypothetical protein
MNLWWKRLSVSLCAAIAIMLYLPVLFFYGVVEVQNPALGNVTAHKCGRYSIIAIAAHKETDKRFHHRFI